MIIHEVAEALHDLGMAVRGRNVGKVHLRHALTALDHRSGGRPALGHTDDRSNRSVGFVSHKYAHWRSPARLGYAPTVLVNIEKLRMGTDPLLRKTK